MKVLLVQPPFPDPAFAFSYATEPLGLLTIAGAIPEHEVALLDMRFSKESLEATIAREQPDVVGTSGNTSNLYDIVDILQRVKRLDPELRTVVGGHHATIRPMDFALETVDAVIPGPGERAFSALLAAWEVQGDASQIPGAGLVRDGELRYASAPAPPIDLDLAPLPRRELNTPYLRHYRAFGQAVALVNTSRGCPYNCTFCSIVSEMGGRYVTKAPERVLEDLSRVPQALVRFADGNTFGSVGRARRLAEALATAGLGKRFMVDARADTIVRHPELFEAWRAAGLRFVAVGFESADDEALAAFGKGASVRDNVEAIAVLRGVGAEIIGQFIVDPRFDEGDFDLLISFIRRHGVHYPSFSIATPFPETSLYDERQREIVTRDWRRYDCMHSVMVPRLGWDGFYRRYIGLYEACYGPGRVLESARQWVNRRERPGAASPLLLGAVALQVRLSRGKLARAYGIRRILRG